jgi:type IV pilus assembly protein PilM
LLITAQPADRAGLLRNAISGHYFIVRFERMAKTMGIWGIDIGQCALKTLRCHMEGDKLVADAFDYIEYPKVLSQPEANPVELIKEALEQFLSRNNVKGDRVCISVPGQSGLARYFKPPPVDAKKIADIVKYEAKQQIPFPLEDVIWDYQRMGGGMEVDGIALETEVGLFAMKRDQVFKALQPFNNAEIEVDIIQLAPLSIYNYVVYDLLEKTLPPPEQFDPENPPPSTVVISMGTDTTDLVVTNGYRVWQRNIPLGGNHFTKQLTKELKLTFAKAEHMKRNAHQAEDPKAVFQAMRPIFNDMVTELQRSLGYFQSLDRKAAISNVVVLGNTVKLPGLKQYLTKHLGYNVIDFDHFERLEGDAVAKSPAFRDNLLAFGVCYGLCLQGAEKGRLATNLLPQEITTERLIRAKKPWAVATAGAFLLACALNYMFHFVAWKDVHEDDWKEATSVVTTVASRSKDLKTKDDEKLKTLENRIKIGGEVIGSADKRVLWLELLRAINESMPQTPGRKPGEVLDPNKVPFKDQHELHITQIEDQYFPELKLWWESPGVKTAYQNVLSTERMTTGAGTVTAEKAAAEGQTSSATGQPTTVPPNGTSPSAPASQPTAANPADAKPVEGPAGPGWVIELTGHHYYNDLSSTTHRAIGLVHVRQTLVKNLLHKQIELPDGTFTMKELGIGYPIFAYNSTLDTNAYVKNPYYQEERTDSSGGFGGQKGSSKPKDKKKEKEKENNVEGWPAVRYDFVVQFVWQEKPLSVRQEERRKKKEEADKAKGITTAAPAETASPTETPPAAPAEAQTTKPEAVTEEETDGNPQEVEGDEGVQPEPMPMPPEEPEEGAAAENEGEK